MAKPPGPTVSWPTMPCESETVFVVFAGGEAADADAGDHEVGRVDARPDRRVRAKPRRRPPAPCEASDYLEPRVDPVSNSATP